MIPIVIVDRHNNFTSLALSQPSLAKMESAFRATSFWRDSWNNRGFRAAARDALHANGGLILIGPRVPFEVPSPFDEMFEPIEIGTALGGNREQLKTISGDTPTLQERRMWIAWLGVSLAVLLLVVPFILLCIRGLPFGALVAFVAMFAIVGLIPALFFGLRRRSGRWFLVPGAIAIVRRPARKGRESRITVLSRVDSCLVFRMVRSGKANFLMLELWTYLAKPFRRPVSDREAISVLATWQGSHPPPPDEQLKELVAW